MKKKLTLAQFKRDAASGQMGLKLIERYGQKKDDTICKVVKVKSTSIILLRGDKESTLDIPFASLVEYDGEILHIYDKGFRELNEQEKYILNQWRKIENTQEFQERCKIDALSDGMGTYYQKKGFFDNSEFPYLQQYNPSINDGKINDSKVKGDCILKYKVYKL